MSVLSTRPVNNQETETQFASDQLLRAHQHRREGVGSVAPFLPAVRCTAPDALPGHRLWLAATALLLMTGLEA